MARSSKRMMRSVYLPTLLIALAGTAAAAPPGRGPAAASPPGLGGAGGPTSPPPGLGGPGGASPGGASPEGAFFETRVRPVLATRCVKCHGPQKQEGGLRLDSGTALLKGGYRGPAVVPGDPEHSLLLRAVAHAGGVPKMPPGEKLSDLEIRSLGEWIKQGAAWPDAKSEGRKGNDELRPSSSSLRPSHWSFQPVRRPEIPAVKNRSWVKTPIDAFILAKLEAQGLQPAPPADPRTLIRRVTFDLTGLPPTPEEVDAFLRDCEAESLPAEHAETRGKGKNPEYKAERGPSGRSAGVSAAQSVQSAKSVDSSHSLSPSVPFRVFRGQAPEAAYRRLVERLLASPAYGERWGRHWLDVARYADSNGLDENVHYGNAWRFRDWVVQCFNRDEPFDRFIVAQLAGDLLPPAADLATRREQLIASGFLSIGPKLISEVDDKKMEMDTIDEQIDTVGRTFMGLTIGCARCHDHKFDPISTEDYYALAGIFKSTKTMAIMKKPRMWVEHSLASPEDQARLDAHRKKIEDLKAAATKLRDQAVADLKASLPMGQAPPANPDAAFPAATKNELKRLRDEVTRLEKEPPDVPMAMGVIDTTVADVPVHIRGSYLSLGKMVPRRVPVVLASAGTPQFDGSHSGRLELARWIASPQNPLTGRVLVNRVWRWHFGRGLVPTVDNFGRLGELPSHPELLDYLAAVFTSAGNDGEREGLRNRGTETQSGLGWSLKKLHRLILLSSTYQQSSNPNSSQSMKSADSSRPNTQHPTPNTSPVDPENRLFGRFEGRRLEAEEMRDALLAVSGTLDRTMGGSLVTLKNREYFFDHTSKDATQYDSRRRSLYLPVVRNHLYDVFELFDFGDGAVPQGSRPTTTVAPQALFMMNSDLVFSCASSLAKSLRERSELDDAGRVRTLYERAYGRSPSEKELARARDLLARFDRSQPPGTEAAARAQQSWTWLCQVILASNEFVYVR